MKILVFLVTVIVVAECNHMFFGTSFQRPLVYHHDVQYNRLILRKRIENHYFSFYPTPANVGRSIRGILAYDMTHSGASVNVTQGGLGFNFVNLRMKSDRGGKIHYDIYIYA